MINIILFYMKTDNLKIFFILMILLTLISISSASAGLFGYNHGECDLFFITPPEGFYNAGEMTYNESLFLSTEPGERPYHSLHVYSIGTGYVDKFIDFDEENIEVLDTVDEGNFKAYRTYDGNLGAVFENTTYAYYTDGKYEYQLELSHDYCKYDDAQFKEDVKLLKEVSSSIKRKDF